MLCLAHFLDSIVDMQNRSGGVTLGAQGGGFTVIDDLGITGEVEI